MLRIMPSNWTSFLKYVLINLNFFPLKLALCHAPRSSPGDLDPPGYYLAKSEFQGMQLSKYKRCTEKKLENQEVCAKPSFLYPCRISKPLSSCLPIHWGYGYSLLSFFYSLVLSSGSLPKALLFKTEEAQLYALNGLFAWLPIHCAWFTACTATCSPNQEHFFQMILGWSKPVFFVVIPSGQTTVQNGNSESLSAQNIPL